MQAVERDDRWRAVQDRDRRFDGRFVFGVRTTGIYCRPSCPARRPRRENVVFFPIPEAAEGAGFRSCRRCRPKEIASSDKWAQWIQRVCRLIDSKDDGGVRLDDLGEQMDMSPHHLQRRFKQLMGITPRQYADARRLGAFKAHLRGGRAVAEATYEAGYGSSSRVYERSDSQLGMTPGAYSRGGRGMQIAYAIVDSPLGRLLVAATGRGVSAVCLGDSDTKLEAELRAEYPEADVERDEGAHAAWVKAVVARVGGAGGAEIPLDIRVTAFQWRVFEALREIPRGQTRSYAEIARAIGQPSAFRAVARACATNPVAIVVPCHRVVATSGALSGYRWGVERKRALLAREERTAGRRS